jgi:NAD+ kinase
VIVGVVANPASGRDIRRLVAGASVFGNADKAGMVLRLLAGLGAAGVERVLMMPATDGLSVTLDRLLRAHDGAGPLPSLEPLAMGLTGTADDSVAAVERMCAAGAKAIVVLGGDGTFIGMADRIARAGTDVPILGVNFGSLGFLTEITLPELYESLEAVLAGKAVIEPRTMLSAKTLRDSAHFSEHIVLNDIVITKGALSRIIEMSVMVGSDPVTRVRADGLIIATPTGSTAYNLAAGGPIVHPAVEALLLTPIAPHTLTNRPIVIPASTEVHVRPIMESNDEVFVTFDGQSGFPLQPSDTVTVRCASRPLYVVKSGERTYFDVLRSKLKWGGAANP